MSAEPIVCECGEVAPDRPVSAFNWWYEHCRDQHPHYPINDLLRQECMRMEL